MKHKMNKLLCLILALLMIVGMLPASMFASAAPIVCEPNQLLVDDDFAAYGAKDTVTATVGGVEYQAVMGTNAFTTVTEAVSKAPSNSKIYVAAGEYTESFNITQNIEIYGNGMNVNPNNDDWTANAKRANQINEAVMDDTLITVTTKALTKVIINGFTFTGKSSIKEATAGSTCKGIDVSYNCFYDNEQISAAQGCLYFTGTTVRTGRLAYNRIDNKVAAAKPLTFRNANNFNFIGNYVNITATVGFWLSGEIADQNVTPGQMKMVIEGNHIVSSSTPISANVSYCDLYEATFRNNYLEGNTPLDFSSKDSSTPNKVIILEGNTLKGSTRDVAFWGACAYDPGVITFKNNTFGSGKIHMEWIPTAGMMDLSYNTFLGGPTITATPNPITYPRYDSNGNVLGQMELDNVVLTGVYAGGDKSNITGVVVDNATKTVSMKEILDSTYATLEIAATAKKNPDNSGVTIKYYSDPACTKELTGGNVIDYLKKGTNMVYIKLVTSLDNYSYVVYALSFVRDASHDASITGVNGYEATVEGNTVSAVIPTEDTSPNIQFKTAPGATYQLFADKDLRIPLSGTIINDLPAGSSTYYVNVTAEDGEATKVYVLNLTRAPYAQTEIIKFNTPEFVDYDEDESAFLGVYDSEKTSVDIDVEVSTAATWELYEDPTCKKILPSKGIQLTEGDNVFFIKVTSEAGAAEEVHKVIFRKETAEASKQIFEVTSDALASEVGKDTVYIRLDCNTTTYTPAFDFVGRNWKLFASYEDGVLGAQVPNNLLTGIAGGKHTYYIQVLAADGSSRVYTLTLERELADKALLTAIGGGLDSYVDRFDFTATTQVKDEGPFTPSFKISDKATVAVYDKNGAEVALPIALRKGTSNYTIVVVAENGVNKTEYAWTITCIGDDIEELQEGVVYDPSWADEYSLGDVVLAPINGEYFKTYFGENAFGSWTQARSQAAAKGGILYVMPGVAVDSPFAVGSLKVYGANFAVDPNTSNRYEESYLSAKVTMSGTAPEVKGFTLTETAQIVINNNTTGAQVTNNIFADEEERTVVAINMTGAKAYNNLTIKNNRFELNSVNPAISISSGGPKNVFANNYFDNAADGPFLRVVKMFEGSTVEISDNTFVAKNCVALSLGTPDARDGYLYVHGNTFKGIKAIELNAKKAQETFVFNFYNNKVETSTLSVVVTDAPATMANNLTANKNVFASIDRSFDISYATGVSTADLNAIDLERNYYGTATPGNNAFDNTVSYKPYYQNKEMTQLSNLVRPVSVTVAGRPIIEGANGNYAVVPEDVAELKVAFKPAELPVEALGTATVRLETGAPATAVNVTMNKKQLAYVTVVSPDGTVSEVEELTLYPQTGNPVYDVYNVISATVDGMIVRVVVDNRATAWTPAVATIDALPIAFYADAECTEELSGDIALEQAMTKVYGVVADYETVEFIIYKKQSTEKAILEIADAHTFEYTASATAIATVDNRLTTADLSATVSAGATYKVYSDAACTAEVDATAIDQSYTTLYYKVTAADSTAKTFEVTVSWITVVDPLLLSVKNTTTVSFEDDVLVAEVKEYDSLEGFVAELEVNSGCTYKLYLDETHDAVFKNDTVFFSSNYVNIHVVVTSPDEVLTKHYMLKLTRNPGEIKFVDQDAIPNWAKKAVETTKDLGIVSGEKTKNGYLLNANGKATREVMAAFMVRMLGVDATQYSYVDLAGKFVDADQVSPWAVASMKAAVALNIFSGAKNGDNYYLNPKNNITRQEFAIVFVKAIGADDTDVKSYALNYKDAAAIATWARTYVKIISKLGYMQGSNGNFNPKTEVTRAEIIQTIYNYMY